MHFQREHKTKVSTCEFSILGNNNDLLIHQWCKLHFSLMLSLTDVVKVVQLKFSMLGYKW